MTLPSVSGVDTVYFNGPYALTLQNGEILTPVFIAADPAAELILGDASNPLQTWTILENSPLWKGKISVFETETLILDSGTANPLGAYSVNFTPGDYATLNLYGGSEFRIPREVDFLGNTVETETKIGRLETTWTGPVSAVVDIGEGQTLAVQDGIRSLITKLEKQGLGELKIVANVDPPSNYTPINIGDVVVGSGTLSVVDGTAKVDDVAASGSFSINTIVLGAGATLDIQRFDTIDIRGSSLIVFDAQNGSTVKFYLNSSGYTDYDAVAPGAYINIGKTTFDIDSDIPGVYAPTSLDLFSADGGILYNRTDITFTDNIIGKNYVFDPVRSTSYKIAVELVDSAKFADFAPAGNEHQAAESLDRLVESGSYTPAEYVILAELEKSISSLDYSFVTGEIYASTIAFNYMNSLMTQQALFNNLRNNSLVSYSESGASVVSPQDYDAGRIKTQSPPSGSYPLNYGSASNGSFDRGPLYYNTDTNSYAPGVVPTPPVTGIYNGEYIGGYGDTNSYGMVPKQYSTLRGQEAQYGDPGTLIYSAWAEFLGSSLEARRHGSYKGYESKQAGGLVGLDLFGSCDCRFGVYYGYQYNELDSLSTIGYSESNEHQLGLYHQFGDENVYNIGTIHGGYGRYDTKRIAKILAKTSTLKGKYDTWNAGVTFERGMNFKMNPLTISPYAQIDYNYFNRHHFEEKTDSGPEEFYKLRVNKGNYHSLRGQVGGRVALDMYPGDQQLRIVFNAAYIHEFLDGIYGKTRVSFLGLPSAPPFDIYGNSLGRDWAVLGLGGEWAPIPALDLFARGDYILNKYTRNPGGSAGLKYRW